METTCWEEILPCRPGNTVFCFRKHRGVVHVHSAEVYSLRLIEKGGRLRLRIAAENGCTSGIWGVNVFGSEDEACKALEYNAGPPEVPDEPIWETMLPCKMGDNMYRIRWHSVGCTYYISKGAISGIYFIEHNGQTVLCAAAKRVGCGIWGREVFPTEESAEAERLKLTEQRKREKHSIS